MVKAKHALSNSAQSDCKPRHDVTIKETLGWDPVYAAHSSSAWVSCAATLEQNLIDCSQSKVSPISWEFPLTRHG